MYSIDIWVSLWSGAMSDADRLREEINYLSVLIQQHKEGKKSNKVSAGNKISVDAQYSWKSQARSGASTTKYVPKHYHQSQRKRNYHPETTPYIPKKIPHTTVPPTPDMMANKTGVKFQSKFKWSKEKSAVSQSQQTPTRTSSPTSITYSKMNSATVKSVSTPHVLQRNTSRTKKFVPTAKTNLRKQNVVKKSIYRYEKPDTTSKKQATAVALLSNPVSKANPILKKPQHVLPKRVPEQSHHKWSSFKRQNPAFTINNSTSKWVAKQPRSNPYKLDRKVNASPHKKPSPLKLSKNYAGIRKHSRNSRVLDRRNKSKESESHITLSKSALEDLLKKHSVTLKQVLANRAVVKSHKTARFNKRHEKKRQHCLYFGRFGKCMRGDSCKYIHDPSRIVVCTRFLRGTCRNDKCSFSHKVEKEKIPICFFFLRGKCSVQNCPYLHVYLGKDASVCRKFATTGFCQDADKCKMQHIKCCPDYYETGNCSKGKSCELPHLKIHKQG